MQRTRITKPIHPIDQSRDVIEQSSQNQRGQQERFAKRKPFAVKQVDVNSNKSYAYISDLINVQSLLNIRATQSRQRKLHNTPSFEERIIINVCGDRYETHRETLELYPDSLLGNRKRCKHYYDKTRKEYFFDRNRSCFEAILYYYQSHGRLRRPTYVPIDVFLEEVTFFQLGEEALNQIRKAENIKEVKKVRLPKNNCRTHLWATMEYPDYSIMAEIVSGLSLLMILISTITLAVESLPQYADLDTITCDNITMGHSNNSNETLANDYKYLCSNYFATPFFIIQTICVGFFTLELILRIVSALSFAIFVKNIMNWIDIAAVIPYYITLGIYLTDLQSQIDTTTYLGLRLLRILRFARVLKFYRIFKRVKSLRALGSTIRETLPDFFIMINILTLLSFIFGAAAYFAESSANSSAFDSILKATYWGIITIASVGYGDIVPVTPAGRIIACLCSLCGATTIGMLVSILVDRYQRVFARKLYTNEDVIDFYDYSDDENNETESGRGSMLFHRHSHAKEIEDRDKKNKFNLPLNKDAMNRRLTTDISETLDTEDINENSMSRRNSAVHFIIDYVDSEQHDKSRDLIDTISTAVAKKKTAGENIELSILSDERQQLNPYDVKCHISLSSEEETDDDDDEELTEIDRRHGNKGVLKKF
ncbi:unnamed protein product [Rotaria socialis]|uniref:BTB domain-containing protein n=1 Tax=Rotaria socialis TaxID=392032 RepID=A0A818M272_9BILA|nr:unnamed protein product [Rotaria socialis]CAF3633493.1 unnamed protein product [Rotaria socialis]